MRWVLVIACVAAGCMLGMQIALSVCVMSVDDRVAALESVTIAQRRNIEAVQKTIEVLGYEMIRHDGVIKEIDDLLSISVVPQTTR